MNFPFSEGQFPASIGNTTDRLERPILTVSGLIDTSVIVSWEVVDTATGYLVFVNGTQEYSGSNLTFEVTGLNPWMRNSIQVKAFNGDKESGFTTYIKPSKTLTKPVLTLVSKTDTTVSLAATNPDSLSLIELYQDSVLVSTSSVFESALEALTPDTDYTFTVRVGDGVGNWSDLSTALVVTTINNPILDLLHGPILERDFVWFNGEDSYATLLETIEVDEIQAMVWAFDEAALAGLPAAPSVVPAFKQNRLVNMPFTGTLSELGRNGASYFKGYISNIVLKLAGVTVGQIAVNGSDLTYHDCEVYSFSRDDVVPDAWLSIEDYFDDDFVEANSWPNSVQSPVILDRYSSNDINSLAGVAFERLPEGRKFHFTEPSVRPSGGTSLRPIDAIESVPEGLSSFVLKFRMELLNDGPEYNLYLRPRLTSDYVSYSYDLIRGSDNSVENYRKNRQENYEEGNSFKHRVNFSTGRNSTAYGDLFIRGLHAYLDESIAPHPVFIAPLTAYSGSVILLEVDDNSLFGIGQVFLDGNPISELYIESNTRVWIKIPEEGFALGVAYEVTAL